MGGSLVEMLLKRYRDRTFLYCPEPDAQILERRCIEILLKDSRSSQLKQTDELIKAIKESQDKDSREVDKHSPETKETAQHFAGKNRQ